MSGKCYQCGAKLYGPSGLCADDQPTECSDCCQLCGEPADNEMGEFSQFGEAVWAHAQCGLDAGLPLA